MASMTARQDFNDSYARLKNELWAVCTQDQFNHLMDCVNQCVRLAAAATRATVQSGNKKEGT